MSSAPSGVYGGVSADDRRSARRSRLMAAALDILGTQGWQAAGVRAVCARARLTPRYFYESFEDREALLLEVFDELAAEAADRVLAAIAAADHGAEARSRAAISAFVGMLAEDRRKARVLFVEALGSEVLARRRLQVLRMFAALVAQQAKDFYRPPSGSERLVDTTAFLLAGGLAELLMAWVDGDLDATPEQIVDDCAALFVAMGEGAVDLARRRG